MNINIICVGKIKEKYLNEGIEEFLKRLTTTAKINIREIKDFGDDDEKNKSIEKESQEILKIIGKKLEKNRGYSILLDIGGKNFSSEEMAEQIEKICVSGESTINFIIGGSYGVSDEVKDRVDLRLSFSKMTFPHQLMRLILLEQIYRWTGILNNTKYHK
ncbi:MAG: 23S rRNA (pseudouridine(1915)-N(3))-methyltransferase RlmH [Fusobacteriaceae bacterium]